MSHLPLDARAILEYLNELGYRNITAAQLKEFIKDLRKLIKYEESMGVNVHQKDYFDNLYRKTTASFRAKSDAAVTADDDNNGLRRDGMISSHSKMNADKENNLRKKMVNMEKQVRQENDGMLQQHGVRSGVLRDHKQQEQQHQKPSSKQEASGCSKMTISSTKRRQTLPAPAKPNTAGTSTARTSRATEKSSNAMWIRPRSRSKTPHSAHHTRMDPVQLYQYYQHEWEKFKTNLPGESNRSELRWQIRHKLLGEQ